MKLLFSYLYHTIISRNPLKRILLVTIIILIPLTVLNTEPYKKNQASKTSSLAEPSKIVTAALSYYQDKDYLSALNGFQFLAKQFPHNEKILFNLGLTYYQLHLIYPESQLSYLAHAVKYFKQALTINPYYTAAHNNLIFIQLQIFLSKPETPPYLFIRDLYERYENANFLALQTSTKTHSTALEKTINFSAPKTFFKKQLVYNAYIQNLLLKIIIFTLIALSVLLVLIIKAKHSSVKKQLRLLFFISSMLYGFILAIFLSIFIFKSLQPPLIEEAVIQKKELPLYKEASANSPILTELQEGTLVTLEVKNENWLQISFSQTFETWAEAQIHHTSSSLANNTIFRGWIPADSVLYLE